MCIRCVPLPTPGGARRRGHYEDGEHQDSRTSATAGTSARAASYRKMALCGLSPHRASQASDGMRGSASVRLCTDCLVEAFDRLRPAPPGVAPRPGPAACSATSVGAPLLDQGRLLFHVHRGACPLAGTLQSETRVRHWPCGGCSPGWKEQRELVQGKAGEFPGTLALLFIRNSLSNTNPKQQGADPAPRSNAGLVLSGLGPSSY